MRQPRDLDKSIAGRPEQRADAGRSDLELRGLNDTRPSWRGPTRQSDARDPALLSKSTRHGPGNDHCLLGASFLFS